MREVFDQLIKIFGQTIRVIISSQIDVYLGNYVTCLPRLYEGYNAAGAESQVGVARYKRPG